MLIFYYKYDRHLLPTNLINMFSKFSQSNHDTRSSNIKILNECTRNTRSAEFTLSFSLPKTINSLDSKLRCILGETNLMTFKKKIKQILINRYQSTECQVMNCYPCGLRLFFARYLPSVFRFISIFD